MFLYSIDFRSLIVLAEKLPSLLLQGRLGCFHISSNTYSCYSLFDETNCTGATKLQTICLNGNYDFR